MALSDKTIAAHIDKWREALKKGTYPYRQNWPSRLFRHEPVENAAFILRSGRLLSRNRAGGVAPKDIADKAVIAAQHQSHEYARLYFRPKSPTQYLIEGIRKPHEYYHQDSETHAPILVILVFRAEGILTTDGVCFSDGNMQSGRTSRLSTDAEFQSLPFHYIYHVGPIEQGSDITRCRCAEVLVPDQLVLDDRLQAVLCRSPAERATLLHMLGDAADRWSPLIRVYTEPGIFENRWSYVDSVLANGAGLTLTLHPRLDAQAVKVEIGITSVADRWRKNFVNNAANARSPLFCAINLSDGKYLIEIKVDDCLAYQAVSLIDELPF